jgi:tRNA-dihydrouridine synthase B
VTVKLRSGLEPGDTRGVELAARLADAGVAAIALHPRPASIQHAGSPEYGLVRELAERVDVPVVVSGGLSSAEAATGAYRASGAAAVMVARGALGNPWIFGELTGRRSAPPRRDEVVRELEWVIDRAEEHFGTERAGAYLRKFYPWYLDRLGLPRRANEPLQRAATLGEARSIVAALAERRPEPAPGGSLDRGEAPLAA